MRNGNSWSIIVCNCVRIVLTVPMRNGNPGRSVFTDIDCESSYRTYEEWKPRIKAMPPAEKRSSYRTYEEWKHHARDCSIEELWFLPYLWGMETSSFKSWSSSSFFSSYRTYEEWKPVSVSVPLPWRLGSYRTYEEWKRGAFGKRTVTKPSSYRTYEEWKPGCDRSK